jgi:hypothetical protein
MSGTQVVKSHTCGEWKRVFYSRPHYGASYESASLRIVQKCFTCERTVVEIQEEEVTELIFDPDILGVEGLYKKETHVTVTLSPDIDKMTTRSNTPCPKCGGLGYTQCLDSHAQCLDSHAQCLDSHAQCLDSHVPAVELQYRVQIDVRKREFETRGNDEEDQVETSKDMYYPSSRTFGRVFTGSRKYIDQHILWYLSECEYPLIWYSADMPMEVLLMEVLWKT